ncbi:NH(3)-dependent NAD(+) synthetase [Tahibacter aquaticus]|uniref:NH(3)-dependent NAD(+) synthetase n=1 Tax=Tahibacter aquaticus TaxID=520092 RepID=A0A4R6YM09_9GAMM|nr:ammonia-dependent NAD(+) synthetase [Tahibacter aquaticus]TDR38382.1 NH(3)-dependent NAD(+) synthetase [Tahibacter aquaticus]
MDTDPFAAQREIAAALDVAEHFDIETEWRCRVAFLAEELQRAGRKSLVLGISGGVDSLTAGRLCQLVVAGLRTQGYDARFVAMRLPYGEQRDAHDAEAAIAFIEPDQILRVDIQPAVDATLQSMIDAGASFGDAHAADLIAGNVRARQRMIVQYAAANALHGLVIGTDHAAEAVMGFFTKHGDGACDLAPLTGLTKRRVRALAEHLGAPFNLVQKIPTADLELLRPLHPDEMALGVRYDAIDDFLEGRPVGREVAERIVSVYRNTEHKRAGPRTPPSRRVSWED